MRLAGSLVALTLSSAAYAGGVGIIATGGFKTENLYYYSSARDGGSGPSYGNFADYDQYKDGQILGSVGGGLEFVVGDRDDDIIGVFRGYWMMDTVPGNPTKGLQQGDEGYVQDQALVYSPRTSIRQIGVGTVGLQWNFAGDPDKWRFGATVHAGAGWFTTDNQEFFLLQPGLVFSVRTSRSTQWYVDATYTMRLQTTSISHGMNATTGFRFMFD